MQGQITALYLFDVAESADLERITALMKGATAPARFAPKPAVPAYVQYQQPPLQLEPEALGLAGIDQWQVRYKIFDYAVVSVSLVQPFAGEWSDLIALSGRLTAESTLEREAERHCGEVVDRIAAGLAAAG